MFLATVSSEIQPKTHLELLTFIISYGEDVFPNLRISLHIAVSIASCERSSSKLKLILTYLRSSIPWDRITLWILRCSVLKNKQWTK